jgi:lipopolysaccharide biosynthesis regulator YciM
MFKKVNYIILAALIVILVMMIKKDGKAKWIRSAGKDFYRMAALSNISEKEKNERIKKKFGGIEKLITENKLEKALLLLKQMEATAKGDAHVYFLQGKIHAMRKEYAESIKGFLRAVKHDPDYVDEGCALYKGTLIKEVTLDAIEHYKGKGDSESKKATKLVYAMQRRLAGSCE